MEWPFHGLFGTPTQASPEQAPLNSNVRAYVGILVVVLNGQRNCINLWLRSLLPHFVACCDSLAFIKVTFGR